MPEYMKKLVLIPYGLGKFKKYSIRIKIKFSNKDDAIKYAKKNKINYEVIEPKSKKLLKNPMLIILLNNV